MGSENADGIDQSVAGPACGVGVLGCHPHGGQPKRRLVGSDAIQWLRMTAGLDRQLAPARELELCNFDALQRYEVFPRFQTQVIGYPDRRQDIAKLGGQLPAYAADPADELRVLSPLNQTD